MLVARKPMIRFEGAQPPTLFMVGEWTGQMESQLVHAVSQRNLAYELWMNSLQLLRKGQNNATLIQRNPKLTREKRNAMLRREYSRNQQLREDIRKYEGMYNKWTRKVSQLSQKKRQNPPPRRRRGGGGGGGSGGQRVPVAIRR